MNCNINKKGSHTKLTRLRQILKTHATKPRVPPKRSYLKEKVDNSGAISSAFAYISRFAQYYDNQKMIEDIASDILAMTKWTDVAISVIAIEGD
jgi:hypothetical protein